MKLLHFVFVTIFIPQVVWCKSLPWLELSAMGFVQSKSVYRGAEVWPKANMVVGASARFFNRWLVRGPSLSYEHFGRKDKWELTANLSYFDDNNAMISLAHHDRDHRNRRSNSIEISSQARYKFGYRNLFQVGGFVAQELKRYQRMHTELWLGAPLAPFTSLRSKTSFSHRKTHQYLYGPEAVGGIGYTSVELNFVWPKVPWKGIIMASAQQSWIIKKINQTADYIRSDSEKLVLSTRYIWTFY